MKGLIWLILSLALVACGPRQEAQEKPEVPLDAEWVMVAKDPERWMGMLYKTSAPVNLPDGSRVVCLGAYKGGIWCKEVEL